MSALRGRVVAGLVTLIVLYYTSYQLRSHHSFSAKHLVPDFAIYHPSKQAFAEQVLAHEVSDPFDIRAISKLCLARPPRDDVIIQCVPGTGGVGNIRSYILHCVRFALEAGSSIVLPNFHRRSTTDLAELGGQLGDFEHFFDRQHFIDTLHAACPHITVHEQVDPSWTTGSVEIPHWPESIVDSSLNNPSPWRRQFDTWFDENTVEMKKPVVLASNDPGRDRAVLDDGKEFYYSFGRMLQTRPDARRLAALCIAELNTRFRTHMNPSQGISTTRSYMGAHLRTSSDAVKAGWPIDFDGQTDWYINQTITRNLGIIYAAGGNPIDLQRFAEKAAQLGIVVVNKDDLLSGNDLRELTNMLWDQRGLVDFEVLLRGSQFGGFARSSFSLNIAARRHFLSHVEDPYSDPDNAFADELSTVYGRFDAGWEAECVRTMWP